MERIGNATFAQSLEALDFDRIAASLAGLAQHQPMTKKGIVREHLDAIEAALSRRVGYRVVAQTLTEAGFSINAKVLRRYVCLLRAERGKDEGRAFGTEGTHEPSVSGSTLGAAASTEIESSTRAAEPTEHTSPAPRRSLRRVAWQKNTTNEVEDGNRD